MEKRRHRHPGYITNSWTKKKLTQSEKRMVSAYINPVSKRVKPHHASNNKCCKWRNLNDPPPTILIKILGTNSKKFKQTSTGRETVMSASAYCLTTGAKFLVLEGGPSATLSLHLVLVLSFAWNLVIGNYEY